MALIEKATDVVERIGAGRLKREHIWSNIVHAPEGAWGIADRGYRNSDLVEAVESAAA